MTGDNKASSKGKPTLLNFFQRVESPKRKARQHREPPPDALASPADKQPHASVGTPSTTQSHSDSDEEAIHEENQVTLFVAKHCIGTKIEKEFDGKVCIGFIKSFDEANGMYQVRYSHGIVKDYSATDLEPLVAAAKAHPFATTARKKNRKSKKNETSRKAASSPVRKRRHEAQGDNDISPLLKSKVTRTAKNDTHNDTEEWEEEKKQDEPQLMALEYKLKYSIGTKVQKEFRGVMYSGVLESFDPSEGYYKVHYSDGDFEEYSATDFEKVVVSKSDSDLMTTKKRRFQKRRRVIAEESEDEYEEMLVSQPEAAAASSSLRKTLPGRKAKRKRRLIVEEQEDSDVGDDFLPQEQTKASDKSMDEDAVDAETDSSMELNSTQEESTEVSMGELLPSSKAMKEEQAAPLCKRTKLAAGWSFLDGKGVTPKKKQKRSGKKTGDTDSINKVKSAYTDGDDLPVISEPQDMFDDMISTQLSSQEQCVTMLKSLLGKLRNRPLKVATMCSGTESPILALDMLANSIEDFVLSRDDFDKSCVPLQIEHIFSCEIEPFKQAYIERNFQPPLLFRDIRELGKEEAYTAYGALAKVPNKPGCVDLLVAGTSCVDYSNLNNEKKTIDDKGESGQTWRGLTDWIEKAQPPFVILENVFGAPWETKVKIFDKMGYYATFARLDTKQFYIPHTRQRGYLFAVKKPSSASKGTTSRTTVANWKTILAKFQRPASASLDAFMFRNDDPRVLRGRARVSSSNKSGSSESSNRVDWSKCEARHHHARNAEELGDKRPLTGWSESGLTTMPGFAWSEWVDAQVHRIHDLMDINALRLAKSLVSATDKTMVWNLSQNVDRDTMGNLGLCQCLTPTGVPYVTSRGGPLVGEELLALQGIPSSDLIFTKETEADLKDLAGNAMSTTVVGACILVALLVGNNAIDDRAGPEKSEASHVASSSLVPRALVPAPKDIRITRELGSYSSVPLRLGRLVEEKKMDLTTLLQEAFSSARKCSSEGADKVLPFSKLMECCDCGYTASIDLATPPRKFEEHNFKPLSECKDVRVMPADFRSKLMGVLPMRLKFCGLSHGLLDSLAREEISKEHKIVWNGWKIAFENACLDFGGTIENEKENTTASEFRFTALLRSHMWTVVYRSSRHARLELRLEKDKAVWFFFAPSPQERGRLRDALERPVARMRVDSTCVSLLEGKWELYLPFQQSVELRITGNGNQVASWRSRLGLKGKFEKETRFEILKVGVQAPSSERIRTLIDGEYELLPRCGTACGSLRRRIVSSSSAENQDMFFFLESGRRSDADRDAYVFASCHSRTEYGEYRDIVLQIDPEIEYRPDFSCEKNSQGNQTKTVKAVIPGEWVNFESLSLESINSEKDSMIVFPADNSYPVASVAGDGWKRCPEIVCCDLPLDIADPVYAECKKRGIHSRPLEVNLSKSKRIFDALAFVTTRLSLPKSLMDWMLVDSDGILQLNGEETACQKCSPPKPVIRWALIKKSNRQVFVPIEDGRQAAKYEKLLKDRPSPWLVKLQSAAESSHRLQLQIGCNAASLAHRALGLFPTGSSSRRAMIELSPENKCVFEWRVVPHIDQTSEADSFDFPKLYLTSNKKNTPAAQPLGFKEKFPLRPEQLRSLSWMLEQEASKEPFMEQEVVEAILPNLNWRAEARVCRPVLVRGGIVADEVGYGKTAITLGLIRAAKIGTADSTVNGSKQHGKADCKLFRTSATLVIVPKHLMGQWPREIRKFLGSKEKVQVIKDMSCFNKLTIQDVEDADIIIVNFGVLSGEKYFSRLARFAGVDTGGLSDGGNTGGRHFDSIYKECLTGIAKRAATLRTDSSAVFRDIESDSRGDLPEAEGCHVRMDGKKAVYKNFSEEDAKETKQLSEMESRKVKLQQSDVDPWGLRSSLVQKNFRKMKCPPLELFFFSRLVVDEITYLMDKTERARVHTLVLGLNSTFRWFLTGTPPRENFQDCQRLASLLGIHLGIDDGLPGSKIASKRSFSKEKQKTELETFSAYLDNHSIQWHAARHSLGQRFLDRFVRQNIAEIDEIKCEEHMVPITLPPAERAIYLELEAHLKSLEMNNKKAMKSRKSSSSDREARMQRILEDSDSAEEALLKRCAHFDMSSKQNSTALQTCDFIVDLRTEQKAECEKDLLDLIVDAIRQRDCILERQPRWKGTFEPEKGDVQDRLQLFMDDVNKRNAVTGGADSEVQDTIAGILKAAFDCVESKPTVPSAYIKKRIKSGDNDFGNDTDDKLYQLKYGLREHVHKVRAAAKELCGRIRSLRYFQWVRKFQAEGTQVYCPGCKAPLPCEKVGVLSCCGHVGCLEHLNYHADREECVEPSCQAPVKHNHVVSAITVGAERDSSCSGGNYGAKLTTVVKKVKELVEAEDRVILFVQFRDLKLKVMQALGDFKVKALEVKGTVQQQIKVLDVLQKEKPGKDDPRVLVLTMDDESSAGVNLTTCNHAIFVHPLLADTQQQYDAYETQAIGRIRRYGQTKTVHIWRYFARDTIDTEIFRERTGRNVGDGTD